MKNEEKLQFENLPPHVIDQIFEYLPFTEIARVSVVSPFFLSVGDSVMRKSFFSLHLEIHRELACLKEQLNAIPRTSDYIRQRIPFLRSYYILERNLSELTIVKAVWRRIIYDKMSCSICIARLLQEFSTVLAAAKERNLPQWSISIEVEVKISRISKLYLEYKLIDMPLDYLFGCRIMDIMDTYINKNYEINVRYYLDDNFCIIDANYFLQKPHVPLFPPKLSDPSNPVPTLEDRRQIYMYLIHVVRINNRITLREEQYQRERLLDSSSDWDLLEEDLAERQLFANNDVRTYHLVLPNPQREERMVDGKYIFEETYHSPENEATSFERKNFCSIHLECTLNNAPFSIIDCWKRMKDELISSRYDETELLELVNSWQSCSEPGENSDTDCLRGDYRFDCSFEFNSITNPGVQKLVLQDH